MSRYVVMKNNCEPMSLAAVPILEAMDFRDIVSELLCGEGSKYPIAYFCYPTEAELLRAVLIVGDQHTGEIFVSSQTISKNEQSESLVGISPALAIFERDIFERYGVRFEGHPWLKPVRYPANRADKTQSIANYPFYKIESQDLHEVNVGPVHAGIIEPGVFRFICDGEKVFHLEIALGFQHRGIEDLIVNAKNNLGRIALAEQIAGDTTIGHSVSMARIMEQGSSNLILDAQRVVALEMERIALHTADIGALCGDIAYQLGLVACEALRTTVINTMQLWCGNRFGRGLIRPFGTNHPLTLEKIEIIRERMSDYISQFRVVGRNVMNTPTVLARFDDICTVPNSIAKDYGAIGMAARSCGIERDSRGALGFYPIDNFEPLLEQAGDIKARLNLRINEIEQSYNIIENELKKLAGMWYESTSNPNYNETLKPLCMTISLTEGWRGMICHVALTNKEGALSNYRIFDPSMRNWLMLAQSLRGGAISDFPLSNKSFNLSYCGNDL